MRARLVGVVAGIVAFLAILLATSCHGPLTPTYGRSYRAMLGAQKANPDAGRRPAASGLDSQEAAIVAQSYRQSLMGESAGAPPEQSILLLAPQRAGAPALKPSVPQHR